MSYTIWPCDCRLAMQYMGPDSVDSIVTDPPYGLSKEPDAAEVLRHWLAGDDYVHTGAGFMGKSWDSFVPGPAVWREAYRVLKPGGHLVAFFGTRTYDLGVMALRLAGFEIRDQLAWVFGSGFPKSHDVSKGIDKMLGAERAPKRVPYSPQQLMTKDGQNERPWQTTAKEKGYHELPGDTAATPEAEQWEGWGTALKPAYEPIVLARKPLSERTVAANVLRWGTGALNIDGCRVETTDNLNGGAYSNGDKDAANATSYVTGVNAGEFVQPVGRWPANLTHDGHAGLGEQGRYFYCPKASKADRNRGLEQHDPQPSAASQFRPNHAAGAAAGEDGNPYGRWKPERNIHPTVKPTALMQWLCRMVTPPGGTVLDPFTGSGSTGVAAVLEGFNFVGCEMTPEYLPIIHARIDSAVIGG